MSAFWDTIKSDFEAPLLRDPAVRGPLDVVLSYPGFHALLAYRFIHELRDVPLLARFLSQCVRFWTGIEIHPRAVIGRGVFIDHGMGVVVGETAEIGDGCTIYQGVTLGGTSLTHGKRHPTLGRNVVVGVNAAVLGAIVLGDNARVGGGSIVVKDVPANATVVGVPARIVAQDGKPVVTMDAITKLQRTVEMLEQRIDELEGNDQPEEAWSWVI
jgi:serine O-acetyltransferase